MSCRDCIRWFQTRFCCTDGKQEHIIHKTKLDRTLSVVTDNDAGANTSFKCFFLHGQTEPNSMRMYEHYGGCVDVLHVGWNVGYEAHFLGSPLRI